MFKVVEDETAKFGVRMQSQIGDIVKNANLIFRDTTTGLNFSELDAEFSNNLANDKVALQNYANELANGKGQMEAYNATLREASNTAQEYALAMNTAEFSVN